MKGLIILANGFEDVEAIATIDILRRSKIIVDLVTPYNNFDVISQSNIIIKAEKLLKHIDENEYQFLIIPGGKAVRHELDKNEVVTSLIKSFIKEDKLVATICAAPSLVGKHGFFKDLPFTCFPGWELTSKDGIYQQDKGVIRNGNFITAKSMAYSIDFALEIIAYFQGEEQQKTISKSLFGEL